MSDNQKVNPARRLRDDVTKLVVYTLNQAGFSVYSSNTLPPQIIVEDSLSGETVLVRITTTHTSIQPDKVLTGEE